MWSVSGAGTGCPVSVVTDDSVAVSPGQQGDVPDVSQSQEIHLHCRELGGDGNGGLSGVR